MCGDAIGRKERKKREKEKGDCPWNLEVTENSKQRKKGIGIWKNQVASFICLKVWLWLCPSNLNHISFFIRLFESNYVIR